MITFWRRFVALGLMLLMAGCGGGDKSQPTAQDNAAQAGAAPNAAPQGQGAGAPSASDAIPGAPTGADGGAPPEAAAAPPAKPAYEGPDPIQLLPPSLKQAVGVRLGTLSEPAHPLHKVLFEQFKPITTLLSRAGLKPQNIESVWVGSNRETNDVLLCIRTTDKISPEDVRKSLQAGAALDKVGKAEIFKLADHPVHQNAVGFLDAQTILIGRLSTVTDALKNPKSGSIRMGLEAAKASRAFFWLSQDPDALRQEIAKNTNDALAGLAAQAMMPKGFAVAVAPASAGGEGDNPAGYGGPGGSASGPPAGASGPPPGVGAAGPGGGHGPPGAAGAARPGAGPGAGASGPPAGQAAPGGAGPGALPGALGSDGGATPGAAGAGAEAIGGDGSSGSGDPNSFEIVVGVSFDSEATADAVEKQIKTALQLVQQSGQLGAGAGQAAGFEPPDGAAPPIGVQAAGAGAGAGDGAIPGPGPQQGGQRRPPGGAGQRPPGAGAGMMRPPNAGNVRPGAGAGDASGDGGVANISIPGVGGPEAAMTQIVMNVLNSINVTHEKQNLRVSAPLPVPEDAGPVPLVGYVLQAAGASALGDGLFEGSLDLLARGMKQWGTAQPDAVKGVVRVGQLPLRSGYSWMTQMLPFIGRDDVYSQFDFKKSWDDPNNRLAASQPIPAFLNPADTRTNWTGSQYGGLGLSHFVGVSGVEDAPDVIAATLNRSDPRAGVFGYDRVARPDEITDGQAQTIMIIGSGGLASPWVMGGGATVRGARAPYIDDLRGFGSRGLPKAGAFAVFADGSARVISADIDPAIFKALCTIHGHDKTE